MAPKRHFWFKKSGSPSLKGYVHVHVGCPFSPPLHPQNDLTDLDPIFHQVPTRRVLCLPSAKKRNCFEIHEKPSYEACNRKRLCLPYGQPSLV